MSPLLAHQGMDTTMHTRARLLLITCALLGVCGARPAHAAASYSFSTDRAWSLDSVTFEGTTSTFELDRPFSIGSFLVQSPGDMDPGTLYTMAIVMQLPDFTRVNHVPGNPGYFQTLSRELVITASVVRDLLPDGSSAIVARNFTAYPSTHANYTLAATEVFPFPVETIEIPSFTIAGPDSYDPKGQFRGSITMTIHSQSQSGPVRPSYPDPVPVPEPSSFLIVSAGLGLLAYRRRKSQQ